MILQLQYLENLSLKEIAAINLVITDFAYRHHYSKTQDHKELLKNYTINFYPSDCFDKNEMIAFCNLYFNLVNQNHQFNFGQLTTPELRDTTRQCFASLSKEIINFIFSLAKSEAELYAFEKDNIFYYRNIKDIKLRKEDLLKIDSGTREVKLDASYFSNNHKLLEQHRDFCKLTIRHENYESSYITRIYATFKFACFTEIHFEQVLEACRE